VPLLGLAVACAAPGERGPDFALAPSALPNLGLMAGASVPLDRGPAERRHWRAEARFIDQFLDDKAIADNGLEPAGDWTQLELGLRRDGPIEDRLRWSWRAGLVGFEARGEPNMIDEPGKYFGVYFGFGRFVDFGHGFSFGPEASVLVASGEEDPFVMVPQLTWGLRWAPQRKAE